MEYNKKEGEALKFFCKEFRIPYELTIDGYKEQFKKGTTFMKEVRNHDIKYHISKPNIHNQNPEEEVIH